MKVSVLGCGRWGSFISWYNDHIGNEVLTFGKENSESFQKLKNTGANEYLTYPKSIKLCSDLKKAIDFADVVIISVPCQALRSFASEIKQIGCNKPIVLCMKGLEVGSGKRLTQIADEELPADNRIAVWLGPGHVQEFLAGVPNCMVIDSRHGSLKKKLIEAFSSNLIRFYYGEDLLGNEIGAATKNVIGIAAGILDGLHLSTLKGALMSRGTYEVGKLIKAMGGSEYSAYGLCHLGDYETTLFSKYSNNRNFGEAFIKGENFTKLAEGVSTAKAMKLLGEKYGEELPITSAVYSVIYDKADPTKTFNSLFARSLREEFN